MKDQINEVLEKHGLTVESEFVPWSLSRNAGEKNPSLNWKVTLIHNGRKILTADYSAGMAHCPSYKDITKHMRPTTVGMEMVKHECEKGRVAGYYSGALNSVMPSANPKKRGEILPDSHDVIYSLLMDSEALESDSYEWWAGNFGYDEDSRAGEAVYNACVKIALQFRKIGESVIAELREAYQDY